MRLRYRLIGLAMAAIALGCGDDDDDEAGGGPANLVVRERLAALAPGNIGHRGTGTNQAGNPVAENSIASFQQAMAEGADGIELDVELTADGRLAVMHDDTLDRTTLCSGCVSTMTFAEVRGCQLESFDGTSSGEPPPTLEEVFDALAASALVNIELKVYEAGCITPTTGPTALAEAAVAEVQRLGVADRVFFSSFDAEAAAAVKAADAELYSGLLVNGLRTRNIDQAVQLGLDAIHPGGVFPFVQIAPALVQDALSRGLQVNVWTVDDAASIEAMTAAGATSIITNEPQLVAGLP